MRDSIGVIARLAIVVAAVGIGGCDLGSKDPKKPEAGVIKGTAKTSDGRPIASFGGSIWGYSAKSGQNVTANIEGKDGKYATNVGPGQFATRAWTDVTFNGKKYRIDLEPVDEKGGLAKQDTGPGVVKDFVWKLDGFRAGADARSDDRYYSHHGGSINFNPEGQGAAYWADLKHDYAHKPEPIIPKDAVIELTLTPDGPLIDGSTGKPIVITQKPANVHGYMDRITRGIPIARYKATAKATLPDGSVKQLKVTPFHTFKYDAPDPSTTATIEFEQTKPPSDNVNGVDELNVHVMY